MSAKLQPNTAKVSVTCWYQKVTTCAVFGTSMATVFGVPLPALDDAQNMQARPQRRRADPVEIIDVDELDDDVYQTHRLQAPGPSRPTQRNRHSSSSEVISLVDSDEEDLVVGSNNVRPGKVPFFSSLGLY